MRFIEDGPDIPDELLFAQDDEKVIFFCGAGVSKNYVKLPNFLELTEKILSHLGESDDGEAKKHLNNLKKLDKDPNTKGLISIDNFFNILRSSFTLENINDALVKALTPSVKPDLSAHKIILNLARKRTGETRLITTNFDLLFEECNKNLKSVTRSNLPSIEFADDDLGVVHLHGKISSNYSGVDKDGLVLSSSEFGEAYLAHGWATNFIKSVLGKYTAVFIGYSADDPPIRYLLQGLQQGNSAKHKIYAFQESEDCNVKKQWGDKGVVAITYKKDSSGGHSKLWDSLQAWTSRSKDPAAWRKRILNKGRKSPAKLKPHERGMIAHILKSESGTRELINIKKTLPAEWLCVFDDKIRLSQSENKLMPYALDNELDQDSKSPQPWNAFSLTPEDYETLKDDKYLPSLCGYNASRVPKLPPRLFYLAYWIAKISNQKITARWIGQQKALHPQIINYIKQEMTSHSKSSMPSYLKEAWDRIFALDCHDDHERISNIFSFKKRVKSLGWSIFAVQEYAKISVPFLKRDTIYHHYRENDKKWNINPDSLVKVKVKFPKDFRDIKVPDDYLSDVLNSLRINLEQAIDMMENNSEWILLFSIEPDENSGNKNSGSDDSVSGYVLYFVRLFKRLVELDIEKAKAEYEKWRKVDSVFSRLRIWASGIKNIISEEEFTNYIISLSDNNFWNFYGNRDLLFTLKNRWGELSIENRKLIENKILQETPRPRRIPKSEYKIRLAWERLNRFHWLKEQGCDLSIDLDKLTKKLTKIAPNWKPEYAKQATESGDMKGGASWVKIDTDSSLLKKSPLSEILTQAKEPKEIDLYQFIEYDPFAGFSDDAPLRALSALSLELKQGDFSSKFWEIYLGRESRKSDVHRLKFLISGRIMQIPNSEFQKILLTASRWFKAIGDELRENNPEIYEALWNKFIDTIKQYEKSSKSILLRQENQIIDWGSEAINSPCGNLAELHMTDPTTKKLKAGKGFPKKWLTREYELLNLPNDNRRYAIYIFTYNLSWLYRIDTKWTKLNLLNIILNKNDKDDKEAFWAGFVFGVRQVYPELHSELKPHLLKIACEKNIEQHQHIEILSVLLLFMWKEKLISNIDLRTPLLKGSDEFRNHTLWNLIEHLKNGNWDSEMLILFLQKVWPKQIEVRTQQTLEGLCNIALTQHDCFIAVSKEVSKLIMPIEGEHISIHGILEAENIARKYPEGLLNLLYAILPSEISFWPHETDKILKIIIENATPKLSKSPKLRKLKSRLEY